MFPMFKAQEFIADERNLSGNTFPREQKCVWHHCLLQAKGPPYQQVSQHLLEMAIYFFVLVGSVIVENFYFHQPQIQPPELPELKM